MLGFCSIFFRVYKDGKIIFGFDECGCYIDLDQDFEVFGGNILIIGGVELLFLLLFVKDQCQLCIVLFWDVGSIFDIDCLIKIIINCDGIKIDNFVSFVGVGLIWIIVLGLLSFSLVMLIKKLDNVEIQVFQFFLGQIF